MGNIRESRKQLGLKQRLLLTTLAFFVLICQTFESYWQDLNKRAVI
jgi:hypothetical protein